MFNLKKNFVVSYECNYNFYEEDNHIYSSYHPRYFQNQIQNKILEKIDIDNTNEDACFYFINGFKFEENRNYKLEVFYGLNTTGTNENNFIFANKYCDILIEAFKREGLNVEIQKYPDMLVFTLHLTKKLEAHLFYTTLRSLYEFGGAPSIVKDSPGIKNIIENNDFDLSYKFGFKLENNLEFYAFDRILIFELYKEHVLDKNIPVGKAVSFFQFSNIFYFLFRGNGLGNIQHMLNCFTHFFFEKNTNKLIREGILVNKFDNQNQFLHLQLDGYLNENSSNYFKKKVKSTFSIGTYSMFQNIEISDETIEQIKQMIE